LVVSADVPPQDGETNEQCQERENANAATTVQRQQNSPLLPQAQINNQVNNRLTSDKQMTTPVNNHLRHQLLLSSDNTMTNLAPTEYVQETSSGTLNALALKFTSLQKPT
jgi:hypothetical protein